MLSTYFSLEIICSPLLFWRNLCHLLFFYKEVMLSLASLHKKSMLFIFFLMKSNAIPFFPIENVCYPILFWRKYVLSIILLKKIYDIHNFSQKNICYPLLFCKKVTLFITFLKKYMLSITIPKKLYDIFYLRMKMLCYS